MKNKLLRNIVQKVSVVVIAFFGLFLIVNNASAATVCEFNNRIGTRDACFASMDECKKAGDNSCKPYSNVVFCRVQNPMSCWKKLNDCDGYFVDSIKCVEGDGTEEARAKAAGLTKNKFVEGSFDYIPLEDTFIPKEKASLPVFLKYIFNIGISIVGLSALVMLTIGGITYITSAGNNASAESAKKMIRDAILGVFLALFAWLILYVINPDLVGIDENLEKLSYVGAKFNSKPLGVPPKGYSGGQDGGPSGNPTGLGSVPAMCAKYESHFETAAARYGVDKCLLVGIASQESGCQTNLVSDSAGACGMMQFLPTTAKRSCQWLLDNPVQSIYMAANYLRSNRQRINGYAKSGSYGTVDFGSSYTQSGTLTRPETTPGDSWAYDSGNDDVIASYNAGVGAGTRAKPGPFRMSRSCVGHLNWQCVKNSGWHQTRDYVIKVQNYQRKCESS